MTAISTEIELEVGDEVPTALYRFYAKDGRLLYVGITDSVKVRFKQHAAEKSWWGDVARKTVAWFQTRDAALAAESAAIRNERPIHNIQGAGHAPSSPSSRKAVNCWWSALPRFSPQWWQPRDSDGFVVRTPTDFQERWRGALSGPFAYIRPQAGGKWAAHEIGATMWHQEKDVLHEGFIEGLMLAGRCDAGSPGGQDASIYGFRGWQEAQAAARVMVAIDWTWGDDVLPCLMALATAIGRQPSPRLTAAINALERDREWGLLHDDPWVGQFLRAIEDSHLAARGLVLPRYGPDSPKYVLSAAPAAGWSP